MTDQRTAAAHIVRNPFLSSQLRRDLVQIWVDATNVGGALGLLSPATTKSAERLANATWQAVADGADDLFVAMLDATPIGWVVLSPRNDGVTPHWRAVKRLQVHPRHQGGGYGRALLTDVESFGVEVGLEELHLTVRDGTGVDQFYVAMGFQEVARVPHALRVGPGDDRDEIYMVKQIG